MKLIPSLIPRFNLDYGFNDFTYGIKSIYKSVFDLERLEAIFGDRSFFFTNNGRSSLYVVLQALNLPKGSKVGVPLYSCTVVLDAIIKAGFIPCFIDIDLDNYTMDPENLEERIEDLSAVVVIHTFGRPADMYRVNKIAKDVPVIEDSAHSLLSEYKGEKTGTLGDASFFSFSKYISSGGGGLIILNNNEFEEDFLREVALLNAPPRLSEIKHSLFVYIYSFLYHKPWYGLFAFSLGSYIENSIDIAGKKTFKTGKIGKSDLSIFLRKLETFVEKVELQRRNSKILIEELENTGLVLPYERKDTWCNYFLFPILLDDKEGRSNACEYLRGNGVDTAKLWSMTPLVAKQFYGYKGDCPTTEKIVDRLLTIPNYYSLTDNELLKVASTVKKIGELT
jgi:dTDP-4-amino-4,6-dideoxygalactose transaminase